MYTVSLFLLHTNLPFIDNASLLSLTSNDAAAEAVIFCTDRLNTAKLTIQRLTVEFVSPTHITVIARLQGK